MNTSELRSKLEKTLEHLKGELSQIRTGRATPSLIEDVQVEAYDAKMTVKELGSISVMDPQNMIVQPWDKGLMQSIAKAIRESDLKLNPVEESDRLRVPIPTLTEERRKEYTKIVSTREEEAKQAVRNIRQDVMKDIDKDFNDKEIGEDEKFRQKEETEKIVKEFVEKVEELAEQKKQDILQV